jgi:hypothetical protein
MYIILKVLREETEICSELNVSAITFSDSPNINSVSLEINLHKSC